jgi:hypothetical protein
MLNLKFEEIQIISKNMRKTVVLSAQIGEKFSPTAPKVSASA